MKNQETKGQKEGHDQESLSDNMGKLKIQNRNISAKDAVKSLEAQYKQPKKSEQGL